MLRKNWMILALIGAVSALSACDALLVGAGAAGGAAVGSEIADDD